MIKFFRQFRRQFLSENKFSKYFIYAIGEIILVVIGILIALSINNWNQNRINASKEHGYLVEIKNDLENQIQQFNRRDILYNSIINKGESILGDFSKKGNLFEIDSINTKLSFMMYDLNFPSINTTFNELNSTGQLNLIKEKSLRSNIIKYYQNSEATKESVNSNVKEVFYGHIFPFIKSAIIIHPENFNMKFEKVNKELIETHLSPAFKSNLSIPSKEFEIVNAITLKIIQAKTNKGSMQTEAKNAEQLLNEVYKELNIN
ncbi:DUF6090 family protein [uncultured Psychroserpens sp.]|uniref:DUF6090 family protein n=1 Tax=uncultured Psychroserpens sp. TaxID=255436 RepID=UPI00262A7ED6|nr:DUF6090 family protein [uncultured Psychroserpens sp.]